MMIIDSCAAADRRVTGASSIMDGIKINVFAAIRGHIKNEEAKNGLRCCSEGAQILAENTS